MQIKWSKAVRHRYNYKSFLSGQKVDLKKGILLHAHHLFASAAFPEKATDVTNGVLVTEQEHDHFHRLYGVAGTPDQFKQFAKDFYGITEFPWEVPGYRVEIEQILATGAS